ncbi:MAG: hypothetical protein WC624_06730 [Candidatus Margulisiibacteriota bacterium]
MKRTLFLLLLVIPLLCSCAKAPVVIDRYQPVAKTANEKIEVQDNYLAIKNVDADHAITAMLSGAENIVIVYLKIENKTGLDLTAADYSVRLTDGLDRKPLQLISREMVMEYRARVAVGDKIASGNAMVDLALTQLENMAKTMGSTELAQFITSIDWAIEHYFAFRPVYANRSREGVLCYSVNFIREYPLTLEIKIKGKTINFDFLPIKK